MSDSPPATPRARVGAGSLFLAFAKVSLSGFGGVLPLARHMLVDERNWLGSDEFNELLGLSQVVPGPNILNLAIAFGRRHHGLGGTLAAVTGLILPPCLLVRAVAAVYDHYRSMALLQHAVAGLQVAAAGLILSLGLRIWQGAPRRGWPPVLGLVTLAAVALAHLPLVVVLVLEAPLGVWLAWRDLRREGRHAG